MTSIYSLTNEDFFLEKGQKGMILCTNLTGISLLFFYSDQCVHSNALKPIFAQLPKIVGGCLFATVNVAKNKKTILLSQQSIAKIDYVPYVILYINGKPFMRYKDEYTLQGLSSFVINITKELQKKNQFIKDKKGGTTLTDSTTLGVPICGTYEYYYTDFKHAYWNNVKSRM